MDIERNYTEIELREFKIAFPDRYKKLYDILNPILYQWHSKKFIRIWLTNDFGYGRIIVYSNNKFSKILLDEKF